MEELSAAERRHMEIDLLQAMYPGQIQYTTASSEVKYLGSIGGSITFRLPDTYPEKGSPDVVSATDARKNDLRVKMRSLLESIILTPGEEVLDAMIQSFETALTASTSSNDVEPETNQQKNTVSTSENRSKTAVVWLHHLLNTNKRKLALSPSMNAAPGGRMVSGITKPGYPGILVYSGPAVLVDAHVAELKQQRWQAFQVRYEQESDASECWKFEHGTGIKEVESMSEVVQSISRQDDRDSFLKATGVK